MGWPDVVIALIVGLPGIIAAVIAFLNRRALKTPSGQSIGRIVEKAHELSAVAVHQGTAILQANGHADVPEAAAVDEKA